MVACCLNRHVKGKLLRRTKTYINATRCDAAGGGGGGKCRTDKTDAASDARDETVDTYLKL